MNRRPTPETDALREVIIGQYKEDELTGNGMGNILAALPDIEAIEIERDELRSDLEFRRGLFQLQEQQLNEVRAERDKHHEDADAFLDKWSKAQERAIDAERERDQYKGLLIRLHNDLFVHHGGQAVREFKELFREENYN